MKVVKLPFRVKVPILACGADLKGAFALAKGGEAFLVEGFGDLADPDNLARYEGSIRRHEKLLHIRPRIVACDLHPEYYSSNFAQSHHVTKSPGHMVCRVQHHEAHVASVMVDNSLTGNVIGVAFDGTGYGRDGNMWGGEFFTGCTKNFRRAAHLEYIAMPGGDKVTTEVWRMAGSYLYRVYGDKFLKLKTDFVKKFNKRDWPILKDMINKKINSPYSSSAGRLFDAAGSIVLSKRIAHTEAEIPMELESLAFKDCMEPYDFDIKSEDGIFVISLAWTIKGIVKDLSKGLDKSLVSAKFHNTVALAILKAAIKLKKKIKTDRVVLSGGVFQNSLLRERVARLLGDGGFDYNFHSNLSTSDSGIPVGQIAIANARAICA